MAHINTNTGVILPGIIPLEILQKKMAHDISESLFSRITSMFSSNPIYTYTYINSTDNISYCVKVSNLSLISNFTSLEIGENLYLSLSVYQQVLIHSPLSFCSPGADLLSVQASDVMLAQ